MGKKRTTDFSPNLLNEFTLQVPSLGRTKICGAVVACWLAVDFSILFKPVKTLNSQVEAVESLLS
jgi:hypothetical protein